MYSSIKRQFYNNSENVLESLALQLIKRVHFSEAIDILYQQGVRNFIEAGGGSALTKLVQAKFLGSPFVHAYEANTKLQNLKAKIISLPQPLIHNQNAIPKAIHTPKETGSEAEVISIIKNQLHETKNIQPQSVQEKILIVFKELTNYPDEVLELDADLESELGLDSVKQIEILSRVFRTFALPVPKDIKMSEITSIRKVIRELNSRLNVSESSTAIAATTQGERVGASKIAPEPTEFASDEVQKKILIVFKELTNYPDEVLELDADLESELGLDSVKQIEILSRVFRTFALPVPKDIKMAQFTSIRKVTELLLTKLKTHSELKSTRFSAA